MAHRPLVRTACAAFAGASISLLLAGTSAANSPDKPLAPPRLPDAEAPSEARAEVETETPSEAATELELELVEPERAQADPGPDVDAIRSAIGRRGGRRIDSLAVSLFSDEREALWPMQVGVEVATMSGEIVVPLRDVVVSDGQHTVFSEVIAAPRGSHAFELELTARHHFGDAIELEYDLQVRQAHFQSLTWASYLLHRMSLAPRPQVGPNALAAARADIVEIQERPSEPAHRQIITVEGQRYEIRLYAETLRG